MKFGYTIVFTDDVEQSIAFFEKAFGFKRRFIHESGYGELETGATALAFAAHRLARTNLPKGYITSTKDQPLGVEIGLVSDDVEADYQRALACGAMSISAPSSKPWGQTVSYVRCPDGTLVEICSAIG